MRDWIKKLGLGLGLGLLVIFGGVSPAHALPPQCTTECSCDDPCSTPCFKGFTQTTCESVGCSSICGVDAPSPAFSELTASDDAQSHAAEVGTATSNLAAFVLTVSSNETSVVVSSPGRSDTCFRGSCNFAYIEGTPLTIQSDAQNWIDCAQFSSWGGACAGQGATCNLVINSELSTFALFRFGIPGCMPQ